MLSRMFLSFVLLYCISVVSGLYFHIAETEKKCFIEEIPDETMVVGNYKVEMFDKGQNKYVPTVAGLGMHVEVRDPEDKVVMSRTYAAEGRFTFTSHSAGEHIICLHSNSTAWFGGGKLRIHLDIQIGEGTNDYQQIAAKDKLTELQLRVRQLLDQVEQITKEQNYQRRVHFRVDIGEGANDYNTIAQREKLTELQIRVRQLIDKTDQIKREQDFQRRIHLEINIDEEANDYEVIAKRDKLTELEIRIRQLLDKTETIKKEQNFQRFREERFRATSESTNQRVLWWSIAQTVILLITGFWQMRHLKGFFEAKKLV